MLSLGRIADNACAVQSLVAGRFLSGGGSVSPSLAHRSVSINTGVPRWGKTANQWWIVLPAVRMNRRYVSVSLIYGPSARCTSSE